MQCTVEGIVFWIKLDHQVIVTTPTENMFASVCPVSISPVILCKLRKHSMNRVWYVGSYRLQLFFSDLRLIDLAKQGCSSHASSAEFFLLPLIEREDLRKIADAAKASLRML